jgi:hypothetical protein
MGISANNGSHFAAKVQEAMGHGDRVNKFEVEIQAPIMVRTLNLLQKQQTNLGQNIDVNLMSDLNRSRIALLCKSTTLPEMEVGTVDIWRRGQKFTIRDTVRFSGHWTAEFYNDENLSLRRAFERWMSEIDRYKSLMVPTAFLSNTTLLGYMGDVYIHKKNNQNQDNISYNLKYAFPIKVSETSLNTESTGVSTFTVTFAYSHWETESSNGFSIPGLLGII